MKTIYSANLLIGMFIASLLIAPSSMKAKMFHYVGLKTGYSHEMLSKSVFMDKSSVLSLDASSAIGVPLGANLGFGRYFSPRFGMRIEAEYLYRFLGKFKEGVLKGNTQPADPINLKLQADFQTLLGNVYLDYHISPWVSLYLSAGIGVASFNTTTELQKKSESQKITSPSKRTLSYQAGFGVGYSLVEGLELDLNIRYINFGKGVLPLTQSNSIQGEYPFSAIEALAGLIYRF